MDIDNIIEIVRTLKEEAPTVSLGAGEIAGTAEAGDEPPVDLRRKKERGWNMFFRDLVKQNKKRKKRKRKS